MKVFVAGGGTGGHFYPAHAVSEELKKRGCQVYYFGTDRGIEAKQEFPSDRKFLFPISGVRGKNLIKAFFSSIELLKTSIQIAKIIKKEKPDFCICFGGYASLPLGIASVITGTPLFIHEQNSIPSYTNRLLSKFARKIFITFDYSKKYFSEEKTVLTGLPIRKSVIDDLSLPKEKAREKVGIDNRPAVLVFGGSQGSKKLSEIALKIAEQMPQIQFILIGGKHFEKPERIPENLIFYSYFNRMGLLYSACDFIISRSGASSTYEIITAGKFALFVPYPYAVSDHQYYNVKWLEEKGLCIIIRENKLDTQELKNIILNALSEDKGEEIKKIAVKNPQKVLIDRILDEINKK